MVVDIDNGRRVRALKGKPYDPWLDLEWEEDELARGIVRENPAGMTLDDIGDHLGLTRERVRQIEVAALRTIRDERFGNGVVELDGFTFALVGCTGCAEPFVRVTGRQEVCPTCSTELRRITPRGRARVHAWEPSPIELRSRHELKAIRSVQAQEYLARVIGEEPVADETDGDPGCSLCGRPSKLEHNGIKFCGIHHPPSLALRHARRRVTLIRKQSRPSRETAHVR